MSEQRISHLYDAFYFAHGCGRPYQRDDVWLNFFDHIAERIVMDIHPPTVLDAGCALGFLVERLRQHGVEAFGVDISEYAIAHTHPTIRPYCWVGSIAEPLPRRYELIVCLEVLEHLPTAAAEQAIANFCAHSDEVLFSSTPFDYKEVTHFNVQPPEYWAEWFARFGFFRDVDFDASFITPWAVRFRRTTEPAQRVIRHYERRFWQLQKENTDLRTLNVELRQHLASPHPITSTSVISPPLAAPRIASLPKSLASTQHVLVISHDVVGKTMAGPGIRYWQLAQVLSQYITVTLAVPQGSALPTEQSNFAVKPYILGEWSSIESLLKTASVIIIPSDVAGIFPQLVQSEVCIVIDGYDPVLAEWLALSESADAETQQAQWTQRMTTLRAQYNIGDFFICASERQRDWWLGLLEAHGRINPFTFGADPSLRQLVDVVPFGLSSAPAQHPPQPIIKGVWTGIGVADRIVLWGGGLWHWLDPLTAIHAIARIVPHRPEIKLVFPGTKHPNIQVANSMPTHNTRARELAHALGLLDRQVFFGEWVPYADWHKVLLESDVALTLHHNTLETRLAFRSRVLDYIWAGVPIVATQGDATSELIAHYGLGECVNAADVDGVAHAILHWLDVPRVTLAERFERARQALTWERAAAPLIRYCQHPYRAADQFMRVTTPSQPIEALQQALQTQRAETAHWQDLAERYAQGRFMRFMAWLRRLRQ